MTVTLYYIYNVFRLFRCNGMYSYRLYNIKLHDPHNILCSRRSIDPASPRTILRQLDKINTTYFV